MQPRKFDIEIPSYHVAKFEKQLEKFRKKAKKLNMPFRCEFFRKEYVERYFDEFQREVTICYHIYEAYGWEPKIDGYKLVAMIDHIEGQNVIRKVPGYEESLESFFHVENMCDHCKTRRKRKRTFVLQDESGSFMQVGSSCAKDFFGHSFEELNFYTSLVSIPEKIPSIGYDSSIYNGFCVSPLEFLTVVSRVIGEYGWVSKKMVLEGYSNQEQTSTMAWKQIFLLEESARELGIELLEIDGSNEYEAQAVLDWAASLEPNGNDYLHNLQVLCSLDYVGSNQINLLASAVIAYRREKEREKKSQTLKDKILPEYFGSIGIRSKGIELEYLKYNRFSSPFGDIYYHHFLTKLGHYLIWKTTKSLALQRGDSLIADFTVKEQSPYRGQKQTIVQRMNVK